ncbi:MAG: hypothetical protein JOZ46_07040 [Candidatus Dormibacteraeota bacterium]|nr:hypothetical protein [Candidatus Dormibacteraeota bacterium]MBV9525552.1 hypothetical protein [Candidatus Dormibacteraeota bacterium]
MTAAILLGPQPPAPRLDADVAALGVDGPVALVTAGYEEAERNDAHLDRALGGGTRNLGLYGRRLDILESDTDFAAALHRLRIELAEQQTLYRARLVHGLAAVDAVRRLGGSSRRSLGTQLDDAISDVRTLDDNHAAAMAAAVRRFEDEWPVHERDVILAHRGAVAAQLEECAAIAVAGGHVGVLLECVWLCGVGPATVRMPLIAWSSGAMVVTERVMVTDEHEIGARPAEVMGTGSAAVCGVVVMVDSQARLRIDDGDSLALLARRCAPRACVLLDDGDRLACADGAPDLDSARVIGLDGVIRRPAEAA